MGCCDEARASPTAVNTQSSATALPYCLSNVRAGNHNFIFILCSGNGLSSDTGPGSTECTRVINTHVDQSWLCSRSQRHIYRGALRPTGSCRKTKCETGNVLSVTMGCSGSQDRRAGTHVGVQRGKTYRHVQTYPLVRKSQSFLSGCKTLGPHCCEKEKG